MNTHFTEEELKDLLDRQAWKKDMENSIKLIAHEMRAERKLQEEKIRSHEKLVEEKINRTTKPALWFMGIIAAAALLAVIRWIVLWLK